MTLHIKQSQGGIAIKQGDDTLFIAPAVATDTPEKLKTVELLALEFVLSHNKKHKGYCQTCGHTLRKGKCGICKLDPQNWSDKKNYRRALLVDTAILKQRKMPNTPKIWRIKIARDLFNLGLRQTKDWVEKAYFDNGEGELK